MSRIDHYHSSDAPPATRIVPAVSAVVSDNAGNIVLHRRQDNGLWSLLGGGLEPGETIISAVAREVKEESGLTVQVGRLIGIYSDPKHVIEYDDGEVRQQFSICFECRIISGFIKTSEESFEVRSFSRDEIDAIGMHPANRQRLDDFWTESSEPFIR
jgi:ADP-ribose pyrophosphatase YjhB (NUDIX family)